MSTHVNIPLPVDSTVEQITFSLAGRPRCRLNEITVRTPTLGQLLQVIKLEPADIAGEPPAASIDRAFAGAVIFCTPPAPPLLSRQRLAWWLQSLRIRRAIRQMSYPQLVTLMRHLEAFALGVNPEQFAAASRAQTPAENQRDSAMQQLADIVEFVAGETARPPAELWDMPGPQLALLVRAVGKRLNREAEMMARYEQAAQHAASAPGFVNPPVHPGVKR